MSFTFSVPTAPGVGLADVLAAGAPGAHATEEVPPGGWPGGYVHLWLPGVSTRGVVELSAERGELDVRLLTCSAREEYELGVALAAAAARLSGTRVRSEDGWELAPAELPGRFGPAWAAQQADAGPGVAMLLAGERGPLSMSGPVRDFHLGARLAGELAAGPEAGLPERLLAAMRRTQWPGERYYPASTYQLSGKVSGATLSFAVWAAVATVIPDVELVMLHAGRKQAPVPVPRGAVPAIAGRYGAWLDEVQLLLEEVPADDWSAVLAAAAAHQVRLPD